MNMLPAIQRVVVFVVLASVAGTASAWSPSVFDVFCGLYFEEGGVGPTGGATAEFYANLSQDLDRAADPTQPDARWCLPEPHRGWLLTGLSESLAWYATLGFANPSPARLGPVTKPTWPLANPAFPTNRVYAAELLAPTSVEAWTSAPNLLEPFLVERTIGVTALNCGAIDAQAPERSGLAYMIYNPAKLVRGPAHETAFVGAHELVHVVQRAQPAYASEAACNEMPKWIDEGLADALGSAFVHRTEAVAWHPDDGQLFSRDLLNLRRFDASLFTNAPFPEPDWTLAYGASSFWRWLVERYADGDHALLARVLATPPANPDAPDWIHWLDAGFGRTGPWGIAHDLPIAFASFLGSYADWGTSRWPHVGDAAWRPLAFGACETVTLTPDAPVARVDVTLEPYAGRCVNVTVDGVPHGQRAWYSIRAPGELAPNAAAGNRLPGDDLHVAKVYWDGDLLDPNVLTTCLAEDLGTEPTDVIPACVLQRDAAANATTLAYALLTPERDGGSWTDLLVLVRAPERPTDAEYRGLPTRDYRVTFALETSAATVDGGSLGRVYGSGNDRPPGLRQMPMLAGDGFADPDAIDVSKLMFFQQAPGGLAPEFVTPGAEGLYRLWLIDGDDPGEDDFRFLFTLTPEGAGLPYGATGTFSDWTLSGTDADRLESFDFMLGGDRGAASVSVLAWTEDHLRVRVRGDWCYSSERDRDGRCTVTHTLDADLWLAFGDAYDGSNLFVTVDTPMQAIYRETFARAVWGDFEFDFEFDPDASDPAESGGGPGGGPGGSAGGGAGGPGEAGGGASSAGGVPAAFVCACTCEVLDEIENFEPEAATQAVIDTIIAMGACAIQCGDAFATCGD